MIPEHRLGVLLHDVKQGWIENCLYHNTAESPSLYVDHMCDRDDFLMRTIHRLEDHEDEVWYISFSNDGRKLATAGKDRTVHIYDWTHAWARLFELADHDAGVCYVSWSPDDSKLITCTREPDNMARIWDAQVTKSK